MPGPSPGWTRPRVPGQGRWWSIRRGPSQRPGRGGRGGGGCASGSPEKWCPGASAGPGTILL
ncbi:hypothetical protein [Ornithinimicrobium kibberense]|uniref:hypothetical protein n=1 Tax=Ornithinimicrobium kibberense TaxID=282060 RepID=UPI00360D9F37